MGMQDGEGLVNPTPASTAVGAVSGAGNSRNGPPQSSAARASPGYWLDGRIHRFKREKPETSAAITRKNTKSASPELHQVSEFFIYLGRRSHGLGYFDTNQLL